MRFSRYTLNTTILKAVDEGLTADPKTLPSWMFYDDNGNKLFQAIMHLPEYYPTRSEYEILKNYKENLLNYFTYDQDEFQLIELGAGDGIKTEILLEYFVSQAVHFNYAPVDVSSEILLHLTHRLHRKLPELDVNPQHGKYEDALEKMRSKLRKVILFLGANIGNYNTDDALSFLKHVSENINSGDLMLIGFDMKKDPRLIQKAYDDTKGITREFNLNLLKRINAELGADFHLDRFEHYPTYDPVTGQAISYLISLGNQEVYIDALNKKFNFKKWETIHTEVSQKYDLTSIQALVSNAGFQIAEMLFDSKKYFCDVLVRK
jgi:L-histidine N-alpha-methyltransferase